jgi:hypothetical protein
MGAGRGETRGAGKAAEAQAHGEELRGEEGPDPVPGRFFLYGHSLGVHTYTLALEIDGKPILIYKHAIKTIEEAPSSPNP